MKIRLDQLFDQATLHRARDYVQLGRVVSKIQMSDGTWRGEVSNGKGNRYTQEIDLSSGQLASRCSCPMGGACKHVAAVLLASLDQADPWQELGEPVRTWIKRLQTYAPMQVAHPVREDEYPDAIKDRLLFVLTGSDPRMRVDVFKGRYHSRTGSLDKAIRRYDGLSLLRGTHPAQFIRSVDLKLLAKLAQSQVWTPSSSWMGWPGLFTRDGDELIGLIRSLCKTGRFLASPEPHSELTWSDECPDLRLGWQITAEGRQRLQFEDHAGRALELRGIDGLATFWIDHSRHEIGKSEHPLDETMLRIVGTGPDLKPGDLAAVTASLPPTLAGLPLPRPRPIEEKERKARSLFPRLILGMELASDGHGYWKRPVGLPVLTLRFVYDGHEVGEIDDDPRLVEAGEIVTIPRDDQWEGVCIQTLLTAGAVPILDLDGVSPSAKMRACDFALIEPGLDLAEQGSRHNRTARDFAFRLVPTLRRLGWDIVETSQWPFRLSDAEVKLSVNTHREAGETFKDNGWFSIGFQAEIGNKRLDLAPLIAAFLEQMREEWNDLPDADALAKHLSETPIYLPQGIKGYVAIDLSPLARFLHLFLTHQSEWGALHPSEAGLARLAEVALAGSSVRFADHAGILPLAHRLEALTRQDQHRPPAGLVGELRDYQTFGAAWIESLIVSGFGGVLADDMGLGKTVQTLSLLQARRERGEQGPALLIVPTSLLHGWKAQAAQFTPDLRLIILHGRDRSSERAKVKDADLVLTTYPLLARDGQWLADRAWPLVILDEAQTLKNPAAQMVKALRDIPAQGRLALTGTPLENSLRDLWTLMDWINPGLLGNRKQFQQVFQTPIEKHGDHAAQARLNRRLRPFLLRRTKDQVAAELPARTEILDWVHLDPSQKSLYETVRSTMDKRVREAIASRGLAGARITVLDALLKLRQVCCDPHLVKGEAARSVRASAKRERLRELLTELIAEGRRVLVFSQFVELLNLIERDLAELGIDYLILTGQTQNRAEILQKFAGGHGQVFLLSLKAGGVGLTLTEADTVILYDPWWNPAVERQAMDRAHRIGQTKPVFVHRLVAIGTVEEKILAMQARKQSLADALFDETGDAHENVLDEATLQDLFAPLSS